MSGPPYPRSPLPGSNGIGLFIIGVSPIGTIPPFDLWLTIISQYANSPILTQIIQSMFAALDVTQLFDEFFDNIWNILTAVGAGLDIWGRILGVSRVLQVPSGDYFGYDEATPGVFGYNQAPYYSGGAITSNFALTDDAYRPLLLAKAASNITNGSIPAINQILLGLFPNRGNCYVTDDGGMSMTYTFKFALTALDLAIVEQSGVLPKPVGVKTSVVVSP